MLQNLSGSYIIYLDANADHATWGSDKNDKRGEFVLELKEQLNFSILNTGEPTYLTNHCTLSHIDSQSQLIT